jgi:hypothetical protein
VGLPQLNPQTLHKATDIGCGYVALDEHLKGDSKTYLSCSIKLCVYQLCKTSAKGFFIATLLNERGLWFLAKGIKSKINQKKI